MNTDALPQHGPGDGSRRLRIWLWVFAFLIMAATAVYQRMTGPTYPQRVSYALGDQEFSGKLIRTGFTDEGAKVKVPAPPTGWTATLHMRRYKTKDAFTSVPMPAVKGTCEAPLPIQPAAGKMEYYVQFAGPDGASVRTPAASEDNPILRYKDSVPAYFLAPHIAFMFLGMMVALRAALAAAFRLREMRVLAWLGLAGLVIGGLILGPIVQKYTFGEFWTGWPIDHDLTDNKALVMCLAWGVACVVLGLKSVPRPRAGRFALLAGGVIILTVYLIPHSMRGSELDYGKLDKGVPAEDAIGTGD